uniref:Uncharacterized protein n=1 Tax=viral metagenome TaxID=1070528 RepID=A0A6C0I675_9ZZZZ
MVKSKKWWETAKANFTKLLAYFHDHITTLNSSKMFAGLMVITLNIVSKFVHIKLGKTLESYLKFSFSRNVLVFAIAWMGTRDVYIALIIMLFFILFTEYLLHEDSALFILSDDFKEHHMKLLDEKDTVTDEEIVKAKLVLEKAEKQKNK